MYWEGGMLDIDNSKLMEQIAAKVHEIWAEWYINQRDNSNLKNIKRWERQAKQNYEELLEEEKEKDRQIVRRVLEVIPDDYFK